MNRYRYMNLTTLIRNHIDENARINQEDREITQRLIEQEIRDRTNRLLRALHDTESLEYDLRNRTIEEEAESFLRWIVSP